MDSHTSLGADASDATLREATEEYARWGAGMTNDKYDEILGKLIRRERIARGLTAEAAAEKAELAYKTYLRIEGGKPVRYQTWTGIETLFDLTRGAIHACRAAHEPPHEVAPILSSTRATQSKDDVSLPPYGTHIEAKSDPGHPNKIPAARKVPNLWERLEGLELDDLRRLRDMIDGAIYTMQRGSIEAEVAQAAVRVADASSAVSMLLGSRQDVVNALSRAEKNNLVEEAENLEHEYQVISQELRRASERLTEAQRSYEHMRHIQADGADKALHYLIRGLDAEYGEAPER